MEYVIITLLALIGVMFVTFILNSLLGHQHIPGLFHPTMIPKGSKLQH